MSGELIRFKMVKIF